MLAPVAKVTFVNVPLLLIVPASVSEIGPVIFPIFPSFVKVPAIARVELVVSPAIVPALVMDAPVLTRSVLLVFILNVAPKSIVRIAPLPSVALAGTVTVPLVIC
jgi:hypothetical protein